MTIDRISQLDIRDIEAGQTYWVVTKPNGRCVYEGMFIAAFLTQKEAKKAAQSLGDGHRTVKTRKPDAASETTRGVKTSGFTEGPWNSTTGLYGRDEEITIWGAEDSEGLGEFVATLGNAQGRDAANARLIVAAPTMYEAIDSAQARLDDMPSFLRRNGGAVLATVMAETLQELRSALMLADGFDWKNQRDREVENSKPVWAIRKLEPKSETDARAEFLYWNGGTGSFGDFQSATLYSQEQYDHFNTARVPLPDSVGGAWIRQEGL